MPTNDERREVAAKLREHIGKHLFTGQDVEGIIGVQRSDFDALLADASYRRLAELIEPEERTCHIIRDHLTDTVFCDVCGERFDGVAQYMGMVPNGFSLADYKEEYKDAKFCPNCGAKVV